MVNGTETSRVTNCSHYKEDADKYEDLEWWVDGVVIIIISSIGIISNLLSIPVLLSRQLTNVFYRTLASLAIFDTIFLICDLLESIRRNHYQRGSPCDEVPFFQTIHLFLFPKFLRPLQMIAMMASTYATVVVALGRYLAVAKPITTMVSSGRGSWKTVLIYILPVILCSFLFKLPIFWEFYNEWCSVDCINGNVVKGTFCSKIINNATKELAVQVGTNSTGNVSLSFNNDFSYLWIFYD